MPLIIVDLQRQGMAPDAARIWLGSVVSLGMLAYAVGKIPGGAMADALGGRTNFLGGMAGSILATLCFVMAGTMPIFTIAWMANRFFQSLGWTGAVQTVSKWFPFRSHGAVMGILSLSYLFGDVIVRQVLSVLIARGFSWQQLFYSSAAVLGTIFLICLALLRESPVAIGEPEAAVNPTNLFQEASPKGIAFLLSFFKSRAFCLVCGISLGTTILRETFNFWVPTYFTQVVHMTPAQAAQNSGIFPLFGGISVILCGWLSDRMGVIGRAAIIFGGMLLSVGALLSLGTISPGNQLISVALVGLVAFLIVGPYSFLAGAISLDFGGKKGSGTASGLIDTVGYIGGMLSGDTIARISAGYGWSGTFVALAGVALFTAVTAAFFLREQRRARLI